MSYVVAVSVARWSRPCSRSHKQTSILLVASLLVQVFTQSAYAYRAYGGSARATGYWWSLEANESWVDYETNYAICPEWNAGTSVRRITVAAGIAVVVGLGQTAQCADGSVLVPSTTLLQVGIPSSQSSALCSSDPAGCTNCSSNQALLSSSSCLLSDNAFLTATMTLSRSATRSLTTTSCKLRDLGPGMVSVCLFDTFSGSWFYKHRLFFFRCSIFALTFVNSLKHCYTH